MLACRSAPLDSREHGTRQIVSRLSKQPSFLVSSPSRPLARIHKISILDSSMSWLCGTLSSTWPLTKMPMLRCLAPASTASHRIVFRRLEPCNALKRPRCSMLNGLNEIVTFFNKDNCYVWFIYTNSIHSCNHEQIVPFVVWVWQSDQIKWNVCILGFPQINLLDELGQVNVCNVLDNVNSTTLYLVNWILKEAFVCLKCVQAVLYNNIKHWLHAFLGPQCTNRLGTLLITKICLNSVFGEQNASVNISTIYVRDRKVLFPFL